MSSEGNAHYEARDEDAIRAMRNEAGELIACRKFRKAVDCLLQLQSDLDRREVHPTIFDNLLNEVLAIASELSGTPLIQSEFLEYLREHEHISVRKIYT